MDALADGLEDLDVDGGGAAIVAVVFTGDGFGDARDDVAGVESEYGGVCVDVVWMEDLWEGKRLENRRGEMAREWVFIRTGQRCESVGSWAVW